MLVRVLHSYHKCVRKASRFLGDWAYHSQRKRHHQMRTIWVCKKRHNEQHSQSHHKHATRNKQALTYFAGLDRRMARISNASLVVRSNSCRQRLPKVASPLCRVRCQTYRVYRSFKVTRVNELGRSIGTASTQ